MINSQKITDRNWSTYEQFSAMNDLLSWPPGMTTEIEITDYGVQIVVKIGTKDARRTKVKPCIIERKTLLPWETIPVGSSCIDAITSAAKGLYLHEFWEWVRYDGKLINDPHKKGYQA